MSLTAAVCGCVTRAGRWHHPKIYSWPAVLIIRSSHYDVLGVSSNATQKDIKAAFIDKSKQYHPDKNSQPNAKKMFAKCAEAYEVLGKEKSRSEYDAKLRESSTTYNRYTSAGGAPDPFQSTAGFNPRPRGRPTGSYSTRTRHDDYTWNPYDVLENDIYLRKGRYYRSQYWKKDEDIRKKKSVDPREAAKREKQLWRSVALLVGIIMTMQFLVESMRASKRLKRQKEISQRRKEREFLANLKDSGDK